MSASGRQRASGFITSSDVVPVADDLETSASAQFRLNPSWLAECLDRLNELAALPRDWDSYGARPLSLESLNAFAEFLKDNLQYVRSAPLLALTSSGSVLARWLNDELVLELTFESLGHIDVWFEQRIDSTEDEGAAQEFPELAKWLWRSSGTN